MRLPTIAILCLASTPALCAPVDAGHAVALFKKVCMAPATSEWIKLGEAEAAAKGWKLDDAASGAKYAAHTSEEVKKTEAPLFEVRTWNFDDADLGAGTLSIWVVRPEWPMLKVNSCTISVQGAVSDALLAESSKTLALDAADLKTLVGGRGWFLEKSADSDRKKLRAIVSSQQEQAGGAISYLGRLEWSIPYNQPGMPRQEVPR